MPIENNSTDPSDASLAFPEYNEVEFEKDIANPSRLVATFIPEDDCFSPITFALRPPISGKSLSAEELSKRPPNKFFIFTGSNRRPLMEKLNRMYTYAISDPNDKAAKSEKGQIPVMLSSKLLSLAWHGLSETQQAPYREEAERRKRLHIEARKSGLAKNVKKPQVVRIRSGKERSKETAPPSVAAVRGLKTEDLNEDDAPSIRTPTTVSLRSTQPTPEALSHMSEVYRRHLSSRPLAQIQSLSRQRYEGQAPVLAPRARPNRNPLGRQYTMPTCFSYDAPGSSASSRSFRGPVGLSRTPSLQSEQDFDVRQPRLDSSNLHGVYAMAQYIPSMPMNYGLGPVNQGTVANDYRVTSRFSYQIPEHFDLNAGPSTSCNMASMNRNGTGHGRVGPAPLTRSWSADTGYSGSDVGSCSDWSGPDVHGEWENSDWLSGSESN